LLQRHSHAAVPRQTQMLQPHRTAEGRLQLLHHQRPIPVGIECREEDGDADERRRQESDEHPPRFFHCAGLLYQIG
jgi:hypothetical protein